MAGGGTKEMKKKSPLNKFLVSTLSEPFYLNVVRFPSGEVLPVWRKEYVGSERRSEAVELRKKFFEEYLKDRSNTWKANELKTVKVTLYK